MELMVGGRSAWMQVERGLARRTRHLPPAAAPAPAASCRSGSANIFFSSRLAIIIYRNVDVLHVPLPLLIKQGNFYVTFLVGLYIMHFW
nr:hypothetical protein [Zea mays]